MKIKNLKLNFKKIKEVSLISVLILTLSSCSLSYKNNNKKVENNPISSTTSTSDKTLKKEQIKSEVVQNAKIKVDDYNYVDLFELDKYYSLYNSGSKYIEHPNSKISGELTSNKLYEIVKSNNDRYMNSMGKSTTYNEISNGNLKDICGYLANTINNYLTQNNKEEVFCSLSNLKIFSKDIMSNASVSDNDVMVISDKFFKFYKKKDMSLEQVVSHEAIHMLQKSCKDRLERDENYIGISRTFEDKTIENFTFSWLYEASAEKCSSSYLSEQPKKYLNDIQFLDMFNFVSMNPNFKLENVCFSKDINDLYNKFNCKTEEEKKELLNVLFSIEVVANKPTNISNKIGDTYEDASLVYKKMKRDIYKYFTKNFFYNLTNNIEDKEMVYSSLALFEAILNSELVLDASSQIEVNADFINYYNEQKELFFDILSYYIENPKVEYEEYLSIVNSSNLKLHDNSMVSKFSSYIGKTVRSDEIQIYKSK